MYSVKIMKGKPHVTLMFCVASDGYKIPFFVILRI